MGEEKHITDLDLVDERITERFRLKKKVNLLISVMIAILGVLTMYMSFFVEQGEAMCRYLTINGTIFTMAGSFVFIIANLYEYTTEKEITGAFVYYVRLSCAVTEAVIMLVVLLAWVMGDESGLNKWDVVLMHVVIPVLTVFSFITNDAPIGIVPPLKRFYCTAFITVYCIFIAFLFGRGILPMDLIPYSYIDWRVVPVWQIVCYAVIVYAIAYGIATILYWLNRKLSWLWFRNLTAEAPAK